MAILTCTPLISGAVGVNPRGWSILTDNTFAQVTTAGYLTSDQNRYGFLSTDYAQVYTTDIGTIELSINVSAAGVVSFIYNNDTALVTLPVVSGNFSVFNGTTGAMKDSGYLPSNAAKTRVMMADAATSSGYVGVFSDSNGTMSAGYSVAVNPLGSFQAGVSGVAGSFSSVAPTASKGILIFRAADNAGNTSTIVTNASFGQASTVTIPDPGASTASFVLNTGTNTMAAGSRIILAKVNGTESANAVTASGMSGVITTSSLTTAANASYSITWTNTFITTTSTVLFSVQGGTNTRLNVGFIITVGAGTATLLIHNEEPTNAFNGTILIGYLVV